jgi:hypothetical protein
VKKVKFKNNTEPCIVYNVINTTEVMEFAEPLGKYYPHIEVEVLGLVPVELVTEAKEHPNNIPAIEIAIELTK